MLPAIVTREVQRRHTAFISAEFGAHRLSAERYENDPRDRSPRQGHMLDDQKREERAVVKEELIRYRPGIDPKPQGRTD